jgi:hypothetical protein
MMILKRVDPFSLAKISSLLYGVMGFLLGLFVSALPIIGLIKDTLANSAVAKPTQQLFFVFLPVLYCFLGLIAGYVIGHVAARVYNWAANRFGGVELELE